MLQIRRIYNNMLPALTGRSKVRVSDRATVLQLTGILQTLTKICYLLQSNLYPADTFWTSASWPSDSWNHFMTSKCILLSIMICNLSICPLNNLKTQFVYAFFFKHCTVQYIQNNQFSSVKHQMQQGQIFSSPGRESALRL